MGPTGVPLMGELRKNLFTRHLKSCLGFIRPIGAQVNRITRFPRESPRNTTNNAYKAC
ncbi:MAG: hypothetical protein E5299_02538 [Burkholderia gladioli]|nr:MAG: hypothetical protein E5299_02538 [Burkholderia gladioli]